MPVFASRRYKPSDVTVETCRWEHARCACVRGQGTEGSGRGRNTRGAALGSTDR